MIDEFTSPPFRDDRDGYVSVEECARRMNLSPPQVMELVSKQALRAYRWGGWGEVLVEPAVVNVRPSRDGLAKREPRTTRSRSGRGRK